MINNHDWDDVDDDDDDNDDEVCNKAQVAISQDPVEDVISDKW